MASASLALMTLSILFLFSQATMAAGEVYKVGDSTGWTVVVNYTTWASNQTFHVGDTIEFVYKKEFHNVLQVNKTDYDACNTASPIATHASGDDKLIITSGGEVYYFICGFPGHCDAAQKVAIPVVAEHGAPAPAPNSSGAAVGKLERMGQLVIIWAAVAAICSLARV